MEELERRDLQGMHEVERRIAEVRVRDEKELRQLREQEAADRIASLRKRIDELEAENRILRQEVSKLQQRNATDVAFEGPKTVSSVVNDEEQPNRLLHPESG